MPHAMIDTDPIMLARRVSSVWPVRLPLKAINHEAHAIVMTTAGQAGAPDANTIRQAATATIRTDTIGKAKVIIKIETPMVKGKEAKAPPMTTTIQKM